MWSDPSLSLRVIRKALRVTRNALKVTAHASFLGTQQTSFKASLSFRAKARNPIKIDFFNVTTRRGIINQNDMSRNLLIVLSGPSGVGKGTIIEKLLKRGDYALSVSCTTRESREGEVNGVSYHFVRHNEFEKLIEENGFLEYSNHFGNYYGTPRAFVEEQLGLRDVILEIEVDGALNVKKAHPEALLIMILPPDENELRARLKKRGSESERKIEERVKRMEYELSKRDEYDYAVINDDVYRAVVEIENIVKENKNKPGKEQI